jgi:hypothetical protein
MMNNLNLIAFMLKSNVFIPPASQVFFTNVDNFLSMKSNWTDSTLDKIEDYIDGFQENQQIGTIKSLGIFLLVGLVLAVLAILTLLLIVIAK